MPLPDSVPIPLDVLAEMQAALDAALRLTLACGARNYDAENAARQVQKAKVKLSDCLSNKSINGTVNCSTIAADKKKAGYHLLRHLDEVKRKIQKDYGIEK